MNRQILNITANEQILSVSNPIHISTNKVSYIEARFDLGTNWSGYDSVRAVWFNDFQCISTVLDANGKCLVPFEVMKRKGNIKVNLVGSISENDVLTDRLTSYPIVAVVVDCVAQITGSETSPITPSQFEQFVAAVISEVEKVTGMTAQAETLPAGSQATARYENGILYLGIPQGIQGERGEAGQDGADGADGNGIASVVYNSDYSLTLVFTNGERFTTPPIRGERGPAGQDGRDGRDGADGITPNLSIGNVETLGPSQDAYVTRRGTDANPIFDFGIPKGDPGEVTLSQLEQILPTDTASGSIASLSDGCDLFNAKSVVIGIEPIQDLHGYDKPWSAGGGVNKIKLSDAISSMAGSSYGLTTSMDGERIKIDGDYNHTGSNASLRLLWLNTSDYDFTNLNVKGFIVSGISSSNVYANVIRYADSNRNALAIDLMNLTPNQHYTILIDAVFYEGSTAPTSWTPYSNECPISGWTGAEVNVSPTTSADDGTVYNISWQTEAGTVYGGTVDVVSGEMTVDRASVALVGGNWSKSTSYPGGFYINNTVFEGVFGARPKDYTPFICSHANSANTLSEYVAGTCYSDQSLNIRIMSADTTVSEWSQYLIDQNNNGTPVQVCVKLATPITYRLTPTDIALLQGTNNVWADCGDTEVTYKADIQGYIDKKINALI